MAGRGRTAVRGTAGGAKKKESNFTVEDIEDFTPRVRSSQPVRTPGDYTRNIGNTKDSRKVIEAAFDDEGRKKQQEPKPSWYNGGSKVKSVKTEVKKKEEEKKPSWYNGGSKVKSVKVKVKKP